MTEVLFGNRAGDAFTFDVYRYAAGEVSFRCAETGRLTHGAVVWLDNDQPDSVLSFLRRESGEDILSVVNLSDRATSVRVTFPEPTRWSCSTLLAEGAKTETDDRGFLLHLEGLGYFVAQRK
ncbi:MAG: alpha-glucosidase C-terminal domain-containing protein [Planctomycetota bacterium]|nr:alpha-glucosidase C-terminal domain-containing protein [Planctomycetota bacterium]